MGGWVGGWVEASPSSYLPGGPEVHVREEEVRGAHLGNGQVPVRRGGWVGESESSPYIQHKTNCLPTGEH